MVVFCFDRILRFFLVFGFRNEGKRKWCNTRIDIPGMFGFADPSLRIKSAAIWQLHISILETQEKQENGFFHSYRLLTKRTQTADKWTLLFGRCHFISLILCQQRQKRRSAFCWKWAGNIQSIKVLNNPALTEGSMSRALVHKCAQTSIDKFYN